MTLDDANAPGTAKADEVQFLPVGATGLVIRFALVASPAVTASVQRLLDALSVAKIDGVTSFRPSLASVLVRFDPARIEHARLCETLRKLVASTGGAGDTLGAAQRVWQVPAAFGGDHGPDLEKTAEAAGMRVEEAIESILDTRLRVLAIGFAPGQPYLGLLPPAWELPRLEEITPSVPRGAIAVAVRQMVMFASTSPTGWRQVARTAFQPFRPDADDPAPLKPGDELRLKRVSGDEMDALLAQDDPAGGATCRSGS